MYRFIDDTIENYCHQYSSLVNPYIQGCYERTLSLDWPIPFNKDWSIHPLEGSFLRFVAEISKAKKALEIGTFSGIGSLMLSEACPVTTIEIDPFIQDIAEKNFQRAPFHPITLLKEDAINALDRLHGLGETFDLIFVDAAKKDYIAYFEKCLPLLSTKGLMLFDNTLYEGQVVDKAITTDVPTTHWDNAQHIHAFNDYIHNHALLDQVILTIRDGISIIKRKKAVAV